MIKKLVCVLIISLLLVIGFLKVESRYEKESIGMDIPSQNNRIIELYNDQIIANHQTLFFLTLSK